MVEGRVIRGCEITVHPVDATAEPVGSAGSGAQLIPTLGEIVDRLAIEYPGRVWDCAPAHRGLRVRSIVVHER